jgi:hypothetical protein
MNQVSDFLRREVFQVNGLHVTVFMAFVLVVVAWMIFGRRSG